MIHPVAIDFIPQCYQMCIRDRFKTVQSKKLDPQKLITHRFRLDQIMEAYETFGNAEKEKALKVILSN